MGGVFSAVASVFKGVGKAVSGRKKKKQIAKPVETIYKEAESVIASDVAGPPLILANLLAVAGKPFSIM